MLSRGKWVSSSDLLKATKQKYFDRRIRELRDELGFDIETGFQKGQPHYRLRSKKRNPTKKRTYLGSADRKELLKESPDKCILCDSKFSPTKKMVFDHRIPLIRNGNGEMKNYQLICHDCNNQKRSQCKGCALECNSCYLAFPEKVPPSIMINIQNKDIYSKIEHSAKSSGLSVAEYCLSVIQERLETNR